MDNGGDGDGSLTLDEWLITMSKVGKAMTDEQFEADLLGMVQPAQSPRGMKLDRVKKLKEIFHKMDEDGGMCPQRTLHTTTHAA